LSLRGFTTIPDNRFCISASIFAGMYKKQLNREQALQKLRHYCRYQERCIREVKEKMWLLGVKKTDHDDLIEKLIGDDYLNEERFAMDFVNGKHKIKQWGRVKIRYELKLKRVNELAIKKGLQQIEDDAYRKTLKTLAEKRYAELKNEQWLVRKKKTIDYLLLKGYEQALINAFFENK
jgi:regulatory protein